MSEETFFDMVCQNYKDDNIRQDLNIGYSHYRWPFWTLPSIALILNIFIIVTHIRRKLRQK
jgi:hypothetical protein